MDGHRPGQGSRAIRLGADYLQLIPMAWLFAYLPWAMQHVYGGAKP
ncbi:hypothetical protein [Pseudoduganella armeniaca]|nr:hypothetical protein [Pseudoduganella armeniaca]